MTVEHRILIGLGDIKSVSFQCDNCGGRITMRLEELKDIPSKCPNGHEWKAGEDKTTRGRLVTQMFAGLNEVRVLTSQKAVGFQILLELDAPEATYGKREV